jgi:hypothetical protein
MIKEILIINRSGIGLFYQNFENDAQENQQVLAGFFSAIQCFAKECTKDNLKAIISGESKYSIVEGDDFSIIIKTSKGLDFKKFEEKINSLKNTFLQEYEDDLSRNNTDTRRYNGFEEIVKSMFKIDIITKHKSSDLFTDLLGISSQKVNFRKIINSL